MKEHEHDASAQAMRLITSKWISGPLYVATRLGIPDMVSESEKSIEELARVCEVNGDILYRIMRALASVGIFRENGDRFFFMTPMAECLKMENMGAAALFFLSPWHNRAWDHLTEGVKTGQCPFEKAFGKPAFQWFMENPDEAEVFNAANSFKAAHTHSAVVDMYDFSEIQTVTDVGGGYGGLVFTILNRYDHIRGTSADLPYMSEDVRNKIRDMKLDDRCRFIPSDFFREVPGGDDCYILSHILHDWNDEQCRAILENCRRAMHEESTLLIIEYIIPEGNVFSIAKLLDLEVLVMGGGKERTEAEFRALLHESEFSLERIITTGEGLSILECKKRYIFEYNQ